MACASLPSIRMRPEVGSTILNNASASVLLPHPVLPAMPICSRRRQQVTTQLTAAACCLLTYSMLAGIRAGLMIPLEPETAGILLWLHALHC